MHKILGAFAGLMVLVGCANPPLPTAEQSAAMDAMRKERHAQAVADMEKAAKDIEPALAECVSFLDDGSFEPATLVAAGFEPYSQKFRSGTGYRREHPDKDAVDISMIEADAAGKVRRCSITTTTDGASFVRVLVDLGFEPDTSSGEAKFVGEGLSVVLAGSYNGRPVYGTPLGPIYYTIKRAAE